ncbi:MAG: hypothetical protein D3923_10985, partial [Candidatus Electrothrix sp. AR3]|nr:hypothetical protein [Candidatus Electrothrix sp. AR3]
MNNRDELQEAKEEAEFLRKRAWDFIDRLGKLESEFKKTVDADTRRSLQTRTNNTRRLLENYEVEYKALCKDAGISPESLTPAAPANDIVSTFSRKALKTEEDLIRNQEIDLPPFFLVPSRNARFTGRQIEVRGFIERVLAGGTFAICGVKGMGGIGKTEIAREVCHLFHETWKDEPQLPEDLADLLSPAEGGFFRDGMLWIQFEPEQQTPKSLTKELIARLIEQPKLAEKIPDLDTLADVLADRDVLVVLDSVEQNLRTFDYVLERFKGRFPLIITSRIAIPGIEAVDINVLKPEEAEALFLRHLDNPRLTEEELETVRELCKMLGNYPLIIKIIASRVEADNSNLAELQETYLENRARLLEECDSDFCTEQRHVDVRTCFMMSFDSLDEEQQHAFLHTALFNNPFTVSALAALLDDADKTEMGHVVSRLQRLSLINRLEGQNGKKTTYELHSLIRELLMLLLRSKSSIAMIPFQEYVNQIKKRQLESTDTMEQEKEDTGEEKLSNAVQESLCKWMKEVLGDKVNEIKFSSRFIDRPAMIVNVDSSMISIMATQDRTGNPMDITGKRDMVINPASPLIKKMAEMRIKDQEFSKDIVEQIYDNAMIQARLIIDP